MQHAASNRAIRVVVQHTKQHNGWSYRLIAYDDDRTYVPVDFATISTLVGRLRLVAPHFGQSYVAIDEEADHSYIAFSADWQLDDAQLRVLGLSPPA